MFLQLNGVEIDAAESELVSVFENVAMGEMSEDGLTQWFMENTLPPEY